MQERYFSHLSKLYDELCDEYSDSPHAVGWFSRATQYKRFEALLDIPDLGQSSILDVGSGQGDLYAYIQTLKLEVDYTGVDLSKNMVNFAKKAYPAGRFLHKKSSEIVEKYDYVLASGAFSFRVEDHINFIRGLLIPLYNIAQKGLVINVLSLLAPLQEQDHYSFYYFKPDELLNIGLEFSSNVKLRHDYLPNDMTLYIFK